jgi:hypothetical protein
MRIKTTFLLLVLLGFFSSIIVASDDYIKVKSPNGGESWELESKQLIEWETSGKFKKFMIYLKKDGLRMGLIAELLNPGSPSFLWEKVGRYRKVGSYKGGRVRPGSNYKILVIGLLTNDHYKGDESDHFFTITTPSSLNIRPERKPPVELVKRIYDISISPPVVGYGYVTGQKLTITWKQTFHCSERDTLFFELWSGSKKAYKRALGKVTGAYSYFGWTIPGDIRSDYYTIKIKYGKYQKFLQVGSQPEEVSGFSAKFHISKKIL